jgi:hypothetical protein
MRQHHHPLALAIVSLAITAASLPGTAYARKSLMEYGGRHASLAHGGRHAGQLRQQSAGNGQSNAGPALSAFPGQGRGHTYGFGHGRAPAWSHRGGAGSYRPGTGANADYLLITMRNGVKLQGKLLAQLAWSSGFALHPVMTDSAGNYVVSVRGRRNSGSNDPTALLASIKTNPNVLDASQAFMGQTRQLSAAPGASISVAASDLIGSVAATRYQWTQLSGTPVQLAQPTDSTLALTLPQTTTSGTSGTTDSGAAAPPGSDAAAASPSLSANRYRLRPTGFRPTLMQTAQHGYGYRYGNGHEHGHEHEHEHGHGHGYGHGHGHGHGHGQMQLAFELIARDSADRAYIGEVVITVQPAATATPGGSSTDPTGDTNGGSDTSGGTGSTDTGATDGTGTAAPGSGGAGSTDTGSGGTGNTDTGSGGTSSTDTGSGGTGNTDTGNGGTVSTDPGTSGSTGGSTDGSGSGTTGSGGVFDGSISAA